MDEVQYGYTSGPVEYLFTETSGNPGAKSSGWQTSRTYTDTGLQPGTTYSYTVSMRAGTLTSATSAAFSATTPATSFASSITIGGTQQFALASGNGYKAVTGLDTFDANGSNKLVVCVALEHSNNDPASIYGVRYNGAKSANNSLVIAALGNAGNTSSAGTLNFSGNVTLNTSLTVEIYGTTTIANNGTGALLFTATVFSTPVGVSGGTSARGLTLSGAFGTTSTP